MRPLTPEEQVVFAAQQGNMAAFESLVQMHHPAVIAAACHLLGNEADADDVAQEVWIRVFRSLKGFRFQSRFSTWLYRITINQALTALKRRGKRAGERPKDVRIDDIEGEFPIAAAEESASDILQGKEVEREFRRALKALPEKQRLAVMLVLFEGLSHREAGEVMRVAEKTVSWHLFQARRKLLQELKDFL